MSSWSNFFLFQAGGLGGGGRGSKNIRELSSRLVRVLQVVNRVLLVAT